MSNYYYKGTSLNKLFTTPWSSNTSTTMSQVFTNGISTGRSNYNTERYNNSQIGYQINGTDVTNYASPVYSDYTSSTSVTPTDKPWVSAITIVCISGGGGGGAGGNGFKKSPNQGKPSQNGGGGGGGGGGEYKIYRGFPISPNTPIQIQVGGGGGGGQGVGVAGGGGGTTTVNVNNGAGVVSAAGGAGANGGNTGSGGQAGAGRNYTTWNVDQYHGGVQTFTTSCNGGTNGQGNNPSYRAPGGNTQQPQGNYLPLTGQYGGGGQGGSGGNYEDQGRDNGYAGQPGFVRIYWLA